MKRVTCALKPTSRRKPSPGLIASFILKTTTSGQQCSNMFRGRARRSAQRKGRRSSHIAKILPRHRPEPFDNAPSANAIHHRGTEAQRKTKKQILCSRVLLCLCDSVVSNLFVVS